MAFYDTVDDSDILVTPKWHLNGGKFRTKLQLQCNYNRQIQAWLTFLAGSRSSRFESS